MDFVMVDNPRAGEALVTQNPSGQDLFFAVRDGNVEEVESLLDKGVDLNSTVEGWTVLTVACELGRVKEATLVVQSCLERNAANCDNKGCCLSAFNEHGHTPLMCAARSGHVDVCKLLLDAGVFINEQSHYVHQTPLLLAIEYERNNVAKFLLARGADVQLTDNVGITPLYAAVKTRNLDVVQALIEAGCDVNIGSQDHLPIFLAARQGNRALLKMLCEAGCQKNIANKYGVTPLSEATFRGHKEVVEYLIEQGCCVNKADMYGNAALHTAAIAGNLDMVKILVNAGAVLYLRCEQGQTPLHYAMEKGRAPVVEYFLQLGVDILRKPGGTNRLTSISAVFERGHVETAAVLIRGCACLPLPHYPGVTEMFQKNGELLKLLFLSGNFTIPGALTVPKIHPTFVCDNDTSVWIQNFHRQAKTLKSMCRVRIRRCLGNKILYSTQCLPIPNLLKDYVMMLKL